MRATLYARGALDCKVVSITPIDGQRFVNVVLKGGATIEFQHGHSETMFLSIDKETLDKLKQI